MSFQRSSALEAQPTTFRREDDPLYSDDPEFRRFTTELSEKLFSLTSNINQLQRQINLLGTKKETERVRERVQDLVEETGNGFKDIGEGLKKVTTWHDLGPGQKFTQGKLNREFRASLAEFQVLQNEAISKTKAARAVALEAQQKQQQQQQTQGGAGGQQQAAQLLEQPRLANQSEVDFQDSLIVERESEIRQIEQSVGELNELFRDVATMVHEQGEQLDIISDNIVSTRDDTRGASQELTTASRHQRSSRNKACCLLLILAVVLTVVILAATIG